MTENEQKLLDYFNDYNFIVANDERDTYRPRSEKNWLYMSRPYRQYICSKHFEFVKWLVNEDKVDMDKAYNGFITFRFNKGAGYRPDLVLLMILAIQDDPIDFLASILK